jgi:hypothetical protein
MTSCHGSYRLMSTRLSPSLAARHSRSIGEFATHPPQKEPLGRQAEGLVSEERILIGDTGYGAA